MERENSREYADTITFLFWESRFLANQKPQFFENFKIFPNLWKILDYRKFPILKTDSALVWRRYTRRTVNLSSLKRCAFLIISVFFKSFSSFSHGLYFQIFAKNLLQNITHRSISSMIRQQKWIVVYDVQISRILPWLK